MTTLPKNLHNVLCSIEELLENQITKERQNSMPLSFLDLISSLILCIKVPTKSKKAQTELSTRLFSLIANLSKKFQSLSSMNQFTYENTKDFSAFIIEAFHILNQFYRPTLPQSTPYEIEKLASNILTSMTSCNYPDICMMSEFFHMTFAFLRTSLRNEATNGSDIPIQRDLVESFQVLHVSDIQHNKDDRNTMDLLKDFVLEPMLDHIHHSHITLLKRIVLSTMMNLFNWIVTTGQSQVSKQHIFLWIIHPNGGLHHWTSLSTSESYQDRVCHYISKWSDDPSCSPNIAVSMKLFCLRFQNLKWGEWISQACNMIQFSENKNIDIVNSIIKTQSEMIFSKIKTGFRENSTFFQSWKWIHIMNHFIVTHNEKCFLDLVLDIWKNMASYHIGKAHDIYVPMNITWYIGQIYWNAISGANNHDIHSIPTITQPIDTIDDKYINWYLCKIMSFISAKDTRLPNISAYFVTISNSIVLLPLEYHQRHQTLDWLILPLCQLINRDQKLSNNIQYLNLLEPFNRLCNMIKSLATQPMQEDKIHHLVYAWLDMANLHNTVDNLLILVQHCHNWILNNDQNQLTSKLILYGIKRESYLFVMIMILYFLIHADNKTFEALKTLFCLHKKSLLGLEWNYISRIVPTSNIDIDSRSLENLYQITKEDCFPYELKAAIWKQISQNATNLPKDDAEYLFLYFSFLYDTDSCISIIQSLKDDPFIYTIKLLMYYRGHTPPLFDCINDCLEKASLLPFIPVKDDPKFKLLNISIIQDIFNQLLYQTLAHGHWDKSLYLLHRYINESPDCHVEYRGLFKDIRNRLYYDTSDYEITHSTLPLFAIISVPMEHVKYLSTYAQQIMIQMHILISNVERDQMIESYVKKYNYPPYNTKIQQTLLNAIAIHTILYIIREEWYLVRNQDSCTERYSPITILDCLLQCYSILKRDMQHEVICCHSPFVTLGLTMLFRDVCWFLSYIYSIMGSFKETIYYYKQGSHSLQRGSINAISQDNQPSYYDVWYKYLWNDIELGSLNICKNTCPRDQNTIIHPTITRMMQAYSLIFNTGDYDDYENLMTLGSQNVDIKVLYTWKSMIQNHVESLGKHLQSLTNSIDRVTYLKKLGCQDEMALLMVFSKEQIHGNVEQLSSFLNLNGISIRPRIIKKVISKILVSLGSHGKAQTTMIQLLEMMSGISFSRKLLLHYPKICESPRSISNYCFLYCTLLSDRDDILVLGRIEDEHNDVVMIDIHNYTEKHFHDKFRDIMIRNKETTKISPQDVNKALWWEARTRLDQEFCSLLETLEQSWLGIFVYWFLPICYEDTREKESTIHAVEKLLYPKKLSLLEKSCLLHIGTKLCSPKSDEMIVRWLLVCWIEWITSTSSMVVIPSAMKNTTWKNKYIIDQIIMYLGDCFKDGENPFIIIKNKSKNPLKTVAMFISDKLQYIPWESMPTLRSLSNDNRSNATGFCRLSCMKAFHFATSIFTSDKSKGNRILYLINPEGDLSSTEKSFVPIFSKFKNNGTGFVGTKEAPLGLESCIDLTSYTLYIYMGHGTGEQYVSPSKIQHNNEHKDKHLPVVFLMGCSSGAFQYRGNFDQDSIVLEYLFKKSPAVVATLWDVTDKDIDRFTMACLEHWGVLNDSNTEKSSLGSSVQKSRSKCLFQGIVASAPVVYGLGHLLYSD